MVTLPCHHDFIFGSMLMICTPLISFGSMFLPQRNLTCQWIDELQFWTLKSFPSSLVVGFVVPERLKGLMTTYDVVSMVIRNIELRTQKFRWVDFSTMFFFLVFVPYEQWCWIFGCLSFRNLLTVIQSNVQTC